MANFDFLAFEPQYKMFAQACIEAEKVYNTSPAMCAIGTRKALELAVKWIYAAEDLPLPYQDNLQALVHGDDFYNTLNYKTWKGIPYIIKLGNHAVHTNQQITAGDALVSLINLFNVIDWIDYSYGSNYQYRTFDQKAIPTGTVVIDEKKVKEQESLLKENRDEIDRLRKQLEAASAELAAAKQQNQQARSAPDPEENISEAETRKHYIDLDLKAMGWQFDQVQIQEEYEVENMAGVPGKKGYVDYVLFGKDGKPLAVIEAKRTSKDPKIGKNQAQCYADALERKFGVRPVIFLSNGLTTWYWDQDEGGERKVGTVFSRDDLQRRMNRKNGLKSLDNFAVNTSICGRYYQVAAIRATCENITQKRRRSLLVMATGTGKTRTAAGLVDLLSRAGHVTNVLFLADRIALVEQAKDSLKEQLPNMSLCNLLENKQDAAASRVIFSTYPTMMNAIDNQCDGTGAPLFTPGHFDLIIIDECHRSIFKKYAAIFEYFDAYMVGLTATPKQDVDRNTFDFFECADGTPTYSYDYDSAVDETFLVPYYNIEVTSAVLNTGIHYDELSPEDRDRYEDDFTEDDGSMPEDVESTDIDVYVFNEKTVDMVLQDLMNNGIKISGGDKIAKTIIFAQNKRHAEYIVERFNKLYPQYGGTFCKRVVCDDTYAQAVIRNFKRPGASTPWSPEAEVDPQIVVSVDMLDTGVDVPHIGNLVFFKKVHSKIKFWQMIGRGTRTCPDMVCVDGQNGEYTGKKYFYIFDYCGNFEFFRENPNGIKGADAASLTESIFKKRVQIAKKLQLDEYQEQDFQDFRKELVEQCHAQVCTLNEELMSVRMFREPLEPFKDITAFDEIDDQKLHELVRHVAPIVAPEEGEETAKRYDNTIYTMILACMDDTNMFEKTKKRLIATSVSLQGKDNIPQVAKKIDIINQTADPAFWDQQDILAIEKVRQELRGLIKFLEKVERSVIYTSVSDEAVDRKEGIPFSAPDTYEDYKAKVNRYVNEHSDTMVIYKLTHNIQLTSDELSQLEHILTAELGDAEDYAKAYKSTPFGVLIRQIAKMDHDAVMAAFSDFINTERLNTQQIAFVHKIVSYVEVNGYIESTAKLLQPPFDKPANFIKLFDESKRKRLLSVVNVLALNAGVS